MHRGIGLKPGSSFANWRNLTRYKVRINGKLQTCFPAAAKTHLGRKKTKRCTRWLRTSEHTATTWCISRERRLDHVEVRNKTGCASNAASGWRQIPVTIDSVNTRARGRSARRVMLPWRRQ